MPDTIKGKPGRKPIHASAAERSAAYRARKTERLEKLMAELTMQPKIAAAPVASAFDPGRIAQAIGEGYRRQRRTERDGQRLKTNAKKAETVLSELIALAMASGRSDIDFDLKAMNNMLAAVRAIESILDYEQLHAGAESAARESEHEKRIEQALRETVNALFGPNWSIRDPILMAQCLLDFEVARAEWGRRRGHDNCIIDGLTGEGREVILRSAVRDDSRARCARVIGEIKLVAAPHGSLFEGSGRKTWFAGWDDIENWWQSWLQDCPGS